MINLYIDLETIKCTNQKHIDYIVGKIKPHHACKTPESKLKSINGQIESVIEKTVFDGSYGEIITIGFAINDERVNSLQRIDTVTEKTILQDFFDCLNGVAISDNISHRLMSIKWIAHNKALDFRFLFKRCVINNINTHGIIIPVDDRRGTKHAYCTMEAWNGFGAKSGGSLDAIARLLGLQGKDGVDGSMV